MSSFLHLLATDLIGKYPDFEDITVIFPNKRGGLFLAEELSRLIDRPIWMPKSSRSLILSGNKPDSGNRTI